MIYINNIFKRLKIKKIHITYCFSTNYVPLKENYITNITKIAKCGFKFQCGQNADQNNKK